MSDALRREAEGCMSDEDRAEKIILVEGLNFALAVVGKEPGTLSEARKQLKEAIVKAIKAGRGCMSDLQTRESMLTDLLDRMRKRRNVLDWLSPEVADEAMSNLASLRARVAELEAERDRHIVRVTVLEAELQAAEDENECHLDEISRLQADILKRRGWEPTPDGMRELTAQDEELLHKALLASSEPVEDQPRPTYLAALQGLPEVDKPWQVIAGLTGEVVSSHETEAEMRAKREELYAALDAGAPRALED